MTKLKTRTALAAIFAVAFALGAATPSVARDRTWVAAGAGFAAGTLIGAAAANAQARAYYEPGYVYAPGYPYASGYVYAPDYGYAMAPGYGYDYAMAPGYGYGYATGPGYVYAPAPALNGDVGIHTYVNGEYAGSDPDPRIRAQLRREARDN
ncbi:MAG: hypothetical protein WEC82_00900 [Xanthobacteraceae bacterium]